MLAELAAAVRERGVSARELVAESYRRIAERNEPLNAVIALRDEGQAFGEAEAVDPAADDDRSLLGLPLLVKDNEDVTGMRTTFGSLLRAGADPATEDSEVVARLPAAGAIVV